MAMTTRMTAAMLAVLVGVGGALSAQRRSSEYSRREAEILGARLFQAILGREAGDQGTRDAAGQIERGKLEAQIEAMIASPEFREKAAGRNPTDLLDQFYRGLLDRAAGDDGQRAWGGDMRQRKYADVVWGIATSPEFESRMLGRPERLGPEGEASARLADACQAEILEQVRVETGRPVLLRFARVDVNQAGRGTEQVRGSATDVLDRDRKLTYRCDVNRDRLTVSRASWDYDDGRRPDPFPVPAVRSCHDVIEGKVGRGVTFLSASIAELTSSIARVRGRARARDGAEVEYACEVQDGRVRFSDVQRVR